MSRVGNENFGLLIAYLIPGFLALIGLSEEFPAVQTWIGSSPSKAPTVGGFLFATIGSVAAGLTVSTIRWLILDHIHAWTGLRRPEFDFSKLQDNIDAFEIAVEFHYRYYQFYGNTIVSVIVLGASRPLLPGFPGWVGVLALMLLVALFFVASRDALRKYYARLTFLHTHVPIDKELSHDKRLAPNNNEASSDQATETS
jgi:hypothetical protein